MKLNKFIIVLTLIVMSGISVFANTATPVVTERKKIENQVTPKDNVQKTMPQQPVVKPAVQKPKAPINNHYQKPKMGVTIYSNNKSGNSSFGKPVCKKCKYPKRTRSYLHYK